MAEHSHQPRFPTESLEPGTRVVLCVEYDGSAFSGWQAQPDTGGVVTVQGEVEAALSMVCASPVRVHCAGRTDAGVHAAAQWAHLDLQVSRSLKSLVVGGNAQLPPSVRITDARRVPTEFHARHSAVARRYDYLIANTRTAPALMARRALWVREFLDAHSMHEALQALLGERDFSAFRAASCQSTTPMRFMAQASCMRKDDYVQITLVANAFLHHMVRNIVGSACRVGTGDAPVRWLGDLLAAADRTKAAATASPDGLYLTGVRYPNEFGIPDSTQLPFLHDDDIPSMAGS
ncbi:MAG: tRNA pseudouridine(38-40) synthase TruA [Pseudomonadota bacterium]